MTRFQSHVERWKDCRACGLCERRTRVVIARGMVPCDVLFVGEGPGRSEDVLGKPFCAPAGHLLDKIIERALPAGVTFALANLVCCLPVDDDGDKMGEPPPESIEACAERLNEFVEICGPRLIVCVGELAKSWIFPSKKGQKGILKGYDGAMAAITHPAAILRANVAQRSLLVQRCVVALANAVGSLNTNL